MERRYISQEELDIMLEANDKYLFSLGECGKLQMISTRIGGMITHMAFTSMQTEKMLLILDEREGVSPSLFLL